MICKVIKECSWKEFSFQVGGTITADMVGDGDGKLPQSVVEVLLDIGNIEEVK